MKKQSDTNMSVTVKPIYRWLIAVFVFSVAPISASIAGKPNPGIAPIDSRITAVKTYAELGAEWWQWALQAPLADSPGDDPVGENCAAGQRGPVWFLAGTFGAGIAVRHCEIPNGKFLFFPVINVAYAAFLNDPPETRTADFVRMTTESLCDSNSIRDISVSIDGVEVARPARFRTSVDQSPIFQIRLPTDNRFGVDESVVPELLFSPVAHKGFYIHLRPLAPGEHTIEWTATWDCNFGGGFEPFSEDATYYLTVLTGVSGQVGVDDDD